MFAAALASAACFGHSAPPASPGRSDISGQPAEGWWALRGVPARGCVDGDGQETSAGPGDVVTVRVLVRGGGLLSPVRAERGEPALSWPAGAASPESGGVAEVARAIGVVTRQRMHQTRVFERLSPSQAWERGEGDCTELADVGAALARGLGYESRVAAGVVDVDGALRFHAWVELATDSGWWGFDPTLSAAPVGVRWLRLDCGATAGQLGALEAAGAGVTAGAGQTASAALAALQAGPR